MKMLESKTRISQKFSPDVDSLVDQAVHSFFLAVDELLMEEEHPAVASLQWTKSESYFLN
ncbi:MAG: hypothetical protein HQM14_11975 [SAR324 cluster bacterium]|nr:hypothetical protein [SAR324 cluster bacterium]